VHTGSLGHGDLGGQVGRAPESIGPGVSTTQARMDTGGIYAARGSPAVVPRMISTGQDAWVTQ
jgi:hypothetical protein